MRFRRNPIHFADSSTPSWDRVAVPFTRLEGWGPMNGKLSRPTPSREVGDRRMAVRVMSRP